MKKSIKILVIDDDSGIGEMLKMLLEMEGYEVMVSEKPKQTKTNIKNNNIDLILLDMLIAGVNGTDVCARIKNDESTAHVKILMMSALHEGGIKSKAAGADGFVAKPFEMEDLLAKIKEVLNQR